MIWYGFFLDVAFLDIALWAKLNKSLIEQLMLLFIGAIVLPISITIIINVIDLLVKNSIDLRVLLMKVGWDFCVVSLGLAGAIIASTEAKMVFIPDYKISYGLISMLWSLSMVPIIGLFRKHYAESMPKAIISLVLGLSTFTIPIGTVIKIVWALNP